MPPRKKTLSELKFSGAIKTNPGRYADRTDPPTLAPIGYAPRYLTSAERAIWRQIVRVAPPGLLTVADSISVELACRLIFRSRTLFTTKASDINALTTLLGKLGLNPIDRAKMVLPTPPTPQAGEFDQF